MVGSGIGRGASVEPQRRCGSQLKPDPLDGVGSDALRSYSMKRFLTTVVLCALCGTAQAESQTLKDVVATENIVKEVARLIAGGISRRPTEH